MVSITAIKATAYLFMSVANFLLFISILRSNL